MSSNTPKIKESGTFNLLTSIWIVPFIAVIIAGWLAYQYFDDLGPEIEVIFPQNEGLVAGQSVVKFKNVPVGKVTKISLDEAVNGVIVQIRMNSKASRPFLTEYARFWIVKPEVGFSGVSGLDTLLSGTYIDVYSKRGGTFKERHIGLPQPYQDSSSGTFYHLTSQDGKNVSIGMPVFYKNIQVGKVAYKFLSLDDKNVEVVVFIEKQYASYVHSNSKFWIKNTMSIDFTKGKIDVDVAPLNYLLTGGIVFSSSGEDTSKTVSSNHVFTLHKSKTSAEYQTIGAMKKRNKKFMLITHEAISQLSQGSVVRFDGFDIGKVIDITLAYNKKTHNMRGVLVIEVDTSVFECSEEKDSCGEDNFYEAIKEGLRAKVASLDPITGSQYIDLTFKHHDGIGKIVQGEKYARLPMASTQGGSIMDTAAKILDKLNDLPLNKLVDSVVTLVESGKEPIDNVNELILSLQSTVQDINKLTSKKSFEVIPDELNETLRQMSKTLKDTSAVVKGYDSDSLVKQQLAQTLEILTKTSEEMQMFLRMLNRKPDSLIFGDN